MEQHPQLARKALPCPQLASEVKCFSQPDRKTNSQCPLNKKGKDVPCYDCGCKATDSVKPFNPTYHKSYSCLPKIMSYESIQISLVLVESLSFLRLNHPRPKCFQKMSRNSKGRQMQVQKSGILILITTKKNKQNMIET